MTIAEAGVVAIVNYPQYTGGKFLASYYKA